MVLNIEGGYFINSWNLMPDWEAEGEHGLHGLYERSRLTACRGAGVTSMYDVHCTRIQRSKWENRRSSKVG